MKFCHIAFGCDCKDPDKYAEFEKRAIKHIKACDETFDRWGDHEYAYQQVRLLALELLEELKEVLDD